jgi:hypothetical protein
MGCSEKPLCSVPLFDCLAPIPCGGGRPAIRWLQITGARFGNLGEKAGFGHKILVPEPGFAILLPIAYVS